MDVKAGDTVSLVVRWGAQKRLQCPRCRHFVRQDGAQVPCRCGAVYEPLSGSESHTVVFA